MPSLATPEPPHVVIVGGGFGGLYAARALRRAPVEVTLIDRRNYHLFQPLLYQVATAALNPSDIATPIRRIVRKQQNCRVLLAEATAVDLAGRRLVLADGELSYDYLVVATGATDSYFGHEEWERLAPGLKSIEEALEIRRRVLLAYEAAERTADADARRAWLTFVVVGAGPTGVELAGALSEIARYALESDFRTIDPQDARVILVEAADRALGTFPLDLSEKATAQLVRLGVEVRVGTKVTEIDEGGVFLGSERVAARTVLWAAGVTASPLARSLGVPLDRAGRVLVDPTLTLPGHPEVFVIGDLAVHQQDGKAITGLAAVAVQEGPHAAANIVRSLHGESLLPFRYVDKGTLATIGRAAAVANLGRVHLSGFIAWLAWLFVHIFLLIGFRNRFLVMFGWASTYLTYDRGARLITGDVKPLRDATSPQRRAEERG